MNPIPQAPITKTAGKIPKSVMAGLGKNIERRSEIPVAALDSLGVRLHSSIAPIPRKPDIQHTTTPALLDTFCSGENHTVSVDPQQQLCYTL